MRLPLDDATLNPLARILALRDPAQPFCHYRGRWVPLGEFVRITHALAERLPAAGNVVNVCEDRFLFLVAFCAAVCAGKTVLLPQSRLASSLLKVHEAFPGAAYVAEGEIEGVSMPFLAITEATLAQGTEGVGTFEGTLRALGQSPLASSVAVVFTSGTTGQPTAHHKSWELLQASAERALRRFGLQSEPLVATVPPQHMFGLECSILYPLVGGVPVYGGRPFYPADVKHALAGCAAPAVLITTPLHLRAMVRAGIDWPKVARIISATAPLSPELASQAEVVFGAPVEEIYGCTETGAIASRRLLKSPDWLPYDGVEVDIDAATARAVARGLPWGRQVVALPDYLEAVGDGRFRLLARPTELVNVAGKRASLAELNRVLLEIPGVEDGVIFVREGGDDGVTVARTAAFVVSPTLSRWDIVEVLRRQFDPVFVPRPVVLIEHLPRTAAGKVERATLARLMSEHRLAERSGDT